jgi:hypothetical protein
VVWVLLVALPSALVLSVPRRIRLTCNLFPPVCWGISLLQVSFRFRAGHLYLFSMAQPAICWVRADGVAKHRAINTRDGQIQFLSDEASTASCVEHAQATAEDDFPHSPRPPRSAEFPLLRSLPIPARQQ